MLKSLECSTRMSEKYVVKPSNYRPHSELVSRDETAPNAAVAGNGLTRCTSWPADYKPRTATFNSVRRRPQLCVPTSTLRLQLIYTDNTKVWGWKMKFPVRKKRNKTAPQGGAGAISLVVLVLPLRPPEGFTLRWNFHHLPSPCGSLATYFIIPKISYSTTSVVC